MAGARRGSVAARPGARAAARRGAEVLEAWDRGEFPASLFSPLSLSIVLEVEDLDRSEKRLAAMAAGIANPAGSSCIALVETAAESARKSLEPLRAACEARLEAMPPDRAELLEWAERRFRREKLEAGPGVGEAIAEACEGDALAFFSELDKLCVFCARRGSIRREDALALVRPVIGADLPQYLAAVALGDSSLAAQRLGRILAAGVGEGAVLWALANLVGGALGGWARYRGASYVLRSRASPRGLSRALDAVYRAESDWKGGRADPVAVLEQATREVCGTAAGATAG